MDETLGRYPLTLEIPVAWGDMDANQHVNNVAYARWIESARVAYFERLGLTCPPGPEGIGPIVARLSIDYLRALTYPDTVRVHATVRAVGRTSITMGYRIWSAAQQADVANGEDVDVLLDYRSGGKVAVDDALRARIAALEATGTASAPRARANGG
jgi:acyl-CoA thioester hydrolase